MAPIFKAIERAENAADNIIELKVSGKLTTEDYEDIITELENRIKKVNRIRLLIELHDFHGWTAGALWEDVKFDFKHFSDIERCAVVGESRWEKGMTFFFKPFTAADVRYFDSNSLEEARRWIREL
jgi:hypothetical protein